MYSLFVFVLIDTILRSVDLWTMNLICESAKHELRTAEFYPSSDTVLLQARFLPVGLLFFFQNGFLGLDRLLEKI